MDCEHEFERDRLEHETEEIPITVNPASDGIIYRTVTFHRVITHCEGCGLEEEHEWERCDCEPDRE